MTINNKRTPRPDWLKVKAPGGESFTKIKNMLRDNALHTVCESARCPNMGECWACGTATFMILGDVCSRNCRFCAITKGHPTAPDVDEPQKLAESIKSMKLHHAVITSVTRDDLADGGAQHWANVILKAKEINPDTTIEVLIPDFAGDLAALQIVIDAHPDILNHNVETVPRLYSTVRPKANYEQSLRVLAECRRQGLRTKTGIMVGLGETKEEIAGVMRDLVKIGVSIFTIGQYLQPTQEHIAVTRYVHPDEFEEFKTMGIEIGLEHVESAPLVRSSYHAERAV
jgi:lipoic acid synthetase